MKWHKVTISFTATLQWGQCNTNAKETWRCVLIRADQSPTIHQGCLRNWGTERLTTQSWQTTPRQSFMWGSGFTWLTFAIKYWNKCSEQGYGLQLHPSKWRHYMWNGAERRANRLSTVTSEGPVTCRASLLYKRVSLCPHGHKHLCVLNSIVLLTGKYVA